MSKGLRIYVLNRELSDRITASKTLRLNVLHGPYPTGF